MHAPPVPEHRVLPTLNEDGSRRRIRPKLFAGKWYRRRLAVGWALIAAFVLIPFIEMNGKPLILLDVAAREFTFFGRTFFATDGVLLMFLMLSIFIGIIALTAIVGRAWCGWGCPQTVYMELLFRPIERLFEGDRNAQLRLDKKGGGLRRVLKNVVFALLALFVGNVFLAYFVGVDTLRDWVVSPPTEHWGGFLVMGITAGLVFFDFAYFREQMCTVICPYARLQSALFDKDSLIIGYDEKRGEPRGKGKPKPGEGDCIDCNACVVACPTGIDIREGLQLECIACAQCIDACNTIMPKVNRPPDLIKYASDRTLQGGRRRILRPRAVVYGVLIAVLVTALILVGGGRNGADVTVLRGIGAPFVLGEDGVRNQVRIKIENRSGEKASYPIQVFLEEEDHLLPLEDTSSRVILPENPLVVKSHDRRTTSLFVVSPRPAFEEGEMDIVVRVTEPNGRVVDVPYQLLGPEGRSGGS